jgi:RNA polymerase sigma factor (sigma-70 family)
VDDNHPSAQDIPPASLRTDAITTEKCDSLAYTLQAKWEACYRAEMPQLIRYLMKCFAESDMRDAADAAQSAFAELFTKWNTVRSPRAWLRIVAFRQMLRQPVEYPLDVHMEPSMLPASAPLELREQEHQVLAALRHLPLAQRQVMALVYDQFSYPEIAEIVGKSEATVRKNTERARAAMKELLGVERTAGSRVRMVAEARESISTGQKR